MNGYTFQTYFVLTIGPPSCVKIVMCSLQDYYGCDVVSQDYIKYIHQFSTLSVSNVLRFTPDTKSIQLSAISVSINSKYRVQWPCIQIAFKY